MKRQLVTILLVALAVSVSAQSTPETAKLAEKLAELLNTKQMFAEYLQQCSAPTSGYDPKYLFRSNPEQFGGISPQSAYWPEVEALFRNYQQHMCAYIQAEEFLSFFSDY